jgi:hypothetical protein
MVQYTFSIFSNNMIQKRILSANEFLISCIGTLLEADLESLASHFEFGCPYGSLVGDGHEKNHGNMALFLAYFYIIRKKNRALVHPVLATTVRNTHKLETSYHSNH